jgi:hypothetical protein
VKILRSAVDVSLVIANKAAALAYEYVAGSCVLDARQAIILNYLSLLAKKVKV